MARNPTAAVGFFAPTGGAGQVTGERIEHFVCDRGTPGDDLASLADALDVAAGHFHTSRATARP